MRIIPQRPEDQPPCPQSGIAGGPIHPAHAVEVVISDRVTAAWPYPDNPVLDDDGEEVINLLQDAVHAAASRQGGMRLYETIASPINPRVNYYQATFFMCLTCGFILPAQVMSR